jgi:sugar O-acyltransferase (sialic acid O-acetyltransferase NeuD family)
MDIKSRLIIYGCGGHGREMAHAARDDLRQIAFLVDAPQAPYSDFPLISHEDLTVSDAVCVAVGDPALRRKLAAKVQRFASIVAPTAVVDPTAVLGEGAQLCDFSFVGSNVSIGRHFQANVRSHVHHDSVIGDFVTLSPGALCLGAVTIEDDVFVGAGACILNGGTTIGKGAVVGMGAVVVGPVAAHTVVVGNPARVIRSSTR